MQRVILFLTMMLCLGSCLSFNTYSLDRREWQKMEPTQLAQFISAAQPELFQKITLHFLREKIAELKANYKNPQINESIYGWFQADKIQNVSMKLDKFMREKLFVKLEMGKLSGSFQQEIEINPENYFLTYDMYDLLID